MQAASATRQAHPVLRASAAGTVAVSAALFGLAFFPSLLLVAIFLVGPAVAAFAFAGPNDRDTFTANAIIASFASGATGAAWLAARADDATEPAAVVVGAVISFVLVVLFAGLVCFAASRVLQRVSNSA
jgi:hypothetical protein